MSVSSVGTGMASEHPTTITVINDASGQPLGDVRVDLAASGRVVTVTTDAQGHSTLLTAAGRYCVRVDISGYVDPLADVTDGCRLLDVQGRPILLRLVPSCGISGIVTDDQGNPIPGAQVLAVKSSNPGRPWSQAGQSTVTDDRGAYSLLGLSPSRYSVAVLPGSENTTVPAFTITFLGSRDYRQAQFLELEAGQTQLANIIVDLHTIARSKLTGAILEPCVTPQKCSASVMLFSRNGLVSPTDQRLTDENGKFEFTDVPVGDYFVGAWTPASEWPADNTFPASAKRAAIKPISIGQDEKQLSMALPPTVKIKGRVIVSDAKGVSGACLGLDTVGLRSEDGWPSLWMGSIAAGDSVILAPLPTGMFRVALPSGVRSCDLIQVRTGTRIAPAGDPIEINAESTSIDLLFAPAGGEVSGIVQHADSAPVRTGYVLLLGTEPTLTRQTVEIVNGRFSFNNIPVGSYDIAAFADVEPATNLPASPGTQVVTIRQPRERVADLVLTIP